VAQGLSNSEIAEHLHIGAATVKTYVSRLLTKFDMATRVHRSSTPTKSDWSRRTRDPKPIGDGPFAPAVQPRRHPDPL